jgi:dephospho-CoA kinase
MKVGITGGIGSGKSIVCKILEVMHFPVYYSDERSKDIVNTNPFVRQKLIKLMGENVYLNNQLNAPFLAKKIFEDDTIRLKVNEIIHPIVRQAFADWSEIQNSPVVFNEAAILFETGAYQLMDATILVTAPLELKINRVIQRDRCSKEQVLERMSKQWDDEQKIPLADFVLINDDIQPLLNQIEILIFQLYKDF